MRFAKQALTAAVLAGLLGVGGLLRAEEPKKPAVAAVAAADSAAPNTLTAQEKADGWVLLFDGKSGEHFRSYNKETLSDKWAVKDGAIVNPGKAGDIITKEQFESFDLSLEYSISKGGNSGIMFKVMEVKGKPPYDSGPEIQIQDNVDAHDPQLAGWLYQMYTPAKDEKTGKPLDATKPVGQWNQLRFRLEGNKGTVWMNGVKYEEFEIGSADWKERLAKSKFAKWENFAKAAKGHICLQDHGNEVAFRNIKIKKL